MSSHEVFGGLINYYRNFGATGGNYYDLQGGGGGVTTVAATSGAPTATVVTHGHHGVHTHGTVLATAHGGQHIVHAAAGGNHPAGQIVTSAGGTTLQILPAMVVPKIEVKTEGHSQQQQQHTHTHQVQQIHHGGGPPIHISGNQKAHIENVHRGEQLQAAAAAGPGNPNNNSSNNNNNSSNNTNTPSKSGEKSDEWRCVYCSKVLSTKGNLKIHVNTVHAGEGTHACPHCHKTFSSKGNLKTHVENLHGDGKKDWLCSFCQKTLSSKGNLKLHIKNVHKNLDGVISGTTPNGSGQVHTPTSAASIVADLHGGNEWRCEFCYKILGSKSALKTHINALHANELGLRKAASWTCQICYKALSSKAALLTHIQIVHEKRRDFKCDACPQTFSSQNLLKTHIKNDHQKAPHTQVIQVNQGQIIPSSGAEAAAAAAAAAAVAAAQAEHNSQSYYCEFCPRDLYGRPTKLFAHPKDLQGHMYTEHGVTVAVPEPAKDEKCHICPKIFPRREDLQAHLVKDHGYGTT